MAPPPPVCFPFTKKAGQSASQPVTSKKKVRRRISWSDSSSISQTMRPGPGGEEKSGPYPVAESITFHSDSEKWDEVPDERFIAPIRGSPPRLARGNSMTGTKKSAVSARWGWGKTKDKDRERERRDEKDKDKDKSEKPVVPTQPAVQHPEAVSDEDQPIPMPKGHTVHYNPVRSNTQSTQSTQRTMNSFRSTSSRSTMPKPRPPLTAHESTSTLVGSAYERKINDDGEPREKPDTTDRLHELRRLMAKDNLDYYIVPSTDAHGSEYVAFSDKRREYISGFSGSGGEAIVTRNNAYLITDSRYWDQAEGEVDINWTVIRAGVAGGPETWIEWLLGRIKGSRIGIDARMISHANAAAINKEMGNRNLDSKLVYPPQNLVDLVWKDKPQKSAMAIYPQPIDFTGKEATMKIAQIREWIRAQPPTPIPFSKREPTQKDMQIGHLITSLPQIAWTLNLRGADIPYNPLFHAYLYIGLDRATLFLDAVKVVPEVSDYLRSINVDRRDYTDLWAFLRRREYGEGKVIITPHTSYAISLMLTHSHYTVIPSHVEHLMAVKNEVEIECMRRAYHRDGVSYVRFLAWLETKLAEGYDITEYEAGWRLTEFRRKNKNFMGLAYENTSASGPNAALPHYVAHRSTASMIDRETPYINDSGGQYRDGTCDTTRTVHFGRPSQEQCEAFTRVLQGHIAIDSAVFPEGTSGHQLDVLARKALWKDGLNYLHGTGHGVGCFLTVHEGPHGFATDVPLVPGHVITNEPGFYSKGRWGIRIESALVVRRVKTRGEFNGDIWLGFERLTCVPIQTKMVKESMLTKEEKQWLKEHNARCYERLAPSLKDDKRALKWLQREANRGIGLAPAPGGVAIEWS